MKTKWFQFYREVGEYHDTRRFWFWSSLVRSEGDKSLPPSSPKSPSKQWKTWRKVIKLRPQGDPTTHFSMGFKDAFGRVMISTAKRRVGDGPFGMRVGPEDCELFIVSNEGLVGLEFVKYTNINDPAEAETPLY